MQLRLLQHVREVTSSFWFIPSFMTLFALAMAVLALRFDLDPSVQQWAEKHAVFFTSGEGARGLLATLAGSSISVAGVVFSITIVVLNMAAAQFGPGLLGKFMHHRGTQFVLGAFVATFTYCLVVLRFVDDQSGFVPHIAANIGFLLGLLSFLLLIYFIHHISVFIQVARVIDDVAANMETVLRESFPARTPNEHGGGDENSDDAERHGSDAESAVVVADDTGYIQAVDREKLLAIAARAGVHIRLGYRTGHFVMHGTEIARVAPPAALDDDLAASLRECLVVGVERSLSQDPEFAIQQLVEIAVRALSPSVNDPFTTLNCIDRMCAALALLATRQLPSRYLRDDAGKVRVILNPFTYPDIVGEAFNQVRQFSKGKAAVTFRMLELITELGKRDLPASFRDALEIQLHAIREDNKDAFTNRIDNEDYVSRLEKAESTLLRIAT